MEQRSRHTAERERWEAQVDRLTAARAPTRVPLTAARVVETALGIVRTEGYDAVTMRRVADGLGSSPGAIYAHVRDKRELDDLMLGALCARIALPVPRADRWQEQAVEVCAQLRDHYLEHPGISRVALGAVPRTVEVMRVFEGLLAVLAAGGVALAQAAWVVDAAFSYTAAYSLVAHRRSPAGDDGSPERDEVVERMEMLPASLFPLVSGHAREITSGEGHERFDFTLGLLVGGLARGVGGPGG